MIKKGDDLAVTTSIINRAVTKLLRLEALLYRVKRNVWILEKCEIIE